MSERPQNNYERWSKSLHKTEGYWCTSMIKQLEQSDSPEHSKLIRRLKNCAQYRRYGLDSGKKPNFCKLRYLCRFCSVRDANNIARQYAKKILDLMIRFELCPIWMTLSPKPGSDLVLELAQLERLLTKIRQQRKNHFSHAKGFTEFCRSRYAMLTLEVKRTKDGQLWFPHVHAIVLNQLPDSMFIRSNLNNEWEKISGSEVRPDLSMTTAGRLFRNWQRSGSISDEMKVKILRDLERMIRYALKPLPLSLPDQISVHSAMRGRHRIREWTMAEVPQKW